MECPSCKKELEQAILHNVRVDYCSNCLGIWFDEDELRQAKDEKDPKLNWVDIDLWKDKKKFEISKRGALCPKCRMPLYQVGYDNSQVSVDLCNLCKGVWLDRGEFKKIIKYLKEKADYEVLYHFSKNLAKQFGEIFIGPEKLRSDALDFITLLKLLGYKLYSHHPYLSETIKMAVPK